MNFLRDFFEASLSLWINMAPYLLLGMAIGGMLHVFLKEDFILRHLGSPSLSAVFKATLFGIPLPLCSCGVIPVAATLRRDGASRSATLAFLTSTPTTGADSILATYSLLGPLFAIFRPFASLLSGLMVGSLGFILDKEPTGVRRCVSASSSPIDGKLRESLRYAFVELPREIGGWLILGILIGGALSALVPERAFDPLKAHPLLESIIILGFSIPLYVCATGSIPIAAALIAKGISPGAALVFLVAGPATNTVTVGFVYSQLGRKATAIYLISIILSALFLGWAFNRLWVYLGASPELLTPGGEFLPLWFKGICGIFLLAAVLYALWLKTRSEEVQEMEYTFYVPAINCEHCKYNIERSLSKLQGVERVVVDISRKTVGVDGEADRKTLEEALREMGYPPEGDGD